MRKLTDDIPAYSQFVMHIHLRLTSGYLFLHLLIYFQGNSNYLLITRVQDNLHYVPIFEFVLYNFYGCYCCGRNLHNIRN